MDDEVVTLSDCVTRIVTKCLNIFFFLNKCCHLTVSDQSVLKLTEWKFKDKAKR